MKIRDAYLLIGRALAHLIDSMNKANAWKDHSADLVAIAAAFRRIAQPLGPMGVENALKAYFGKLNRDEHVIHEGIGTTLMTNIELILEQTDPLGNSRKVEEFASIFESIAAPLGPKGVEEALKAWDKK